MRRDVRQNGGVLYIHFGLDGLIVLATGIGAIWLIACILLKIPLRRALAQAAFAGYLGALLAATLFEYSYGSADLRWIWRSINLIPLRTILELARPEHIQQAVRQLLGNVVMFIPFGMLLPAVAARFRRLGALLVAAVSMSVGIELAQLAMRLIGLAGRSVDVDDVLLNVAGAVMGYFIWRAGAALMGLIGSRPALVPVSED